MPRTNPVVAQRTNPSRIRSVDIATAKGRSAAAARPLITWKMIGGYRDGLAVGYMRCGQDDHWYSRIVVGSGKRKQARLVGVTTYQDAVAAVMATKEGVRATADNERLARRHGLPTVSECIQDYIKFRLARDPNNGRMARSTLAAIPEWFAAKKLNAISMRDMIKLITEFDTSLKLSTIQRRTNDIEAMLRRAYAAHIAVMPPGWLDKVLLGIKQGVEQRGFGDDEDPEVGLDRDVLSGQDVQRLVSEANRIDTAFGSLVAVLAATGARLSQVLRIRGRDLILGDNPILNVPVSRKGMIGRRKDRTHIPVPISSSLAERLARLVREPMDILLLQTDGAEWDQDVFRRRWSLLTDLAELDGVTSYRLRDFSMIRMLSSGLDVVTVAKQHDTGVTWISRAYASQIAQTRQDDLRRLAMTI